MQIGTWFRPEPPPAFDPAHVYAASRVLVTATFSVPSVVANWNAFDVSLADSNGRQRFRRTLPGAPVVDQPPRLAQQVLDALVASWGWTPGNPVLFGYSLETVLYGESLGSWSVAGGTLVAESRLLLAGRTT